MTQGEINAQLDSALDEIDWDEPASFDEQAHEESSIVEQEQASQEPEAQEDSFTGLDPRNLPPELDPVYKSMQADYTRKTQELAEQRKAYESLDQRGGPQIANQAVEFLYRLEQDPNFALQVHNQLSQTLQAQGLSVSDANQEATAQIEDFMSDDDEDFDWEEEQAPSVPPELSQELRQLRSELAEIKQTQNVNAIADDISRQHMFLRDAHQDLTEDDFDRIYDIAQTTDGDLIAAHQKYDEWRNKTIAEYLNRKSSISTPVPLPTGTSGAEPTEFTELTDPNLARHVENILKARGL